MADSYGGLATLTANPTAPSVVSYVDTQTANLVSGANRIALGEDGTIYVADYYDGLHVFAPDVGGVPSHIGFVEGQSFTYDILVDSADPSVGYTAAGAYGLVRLDLDAADGPVETGRAHDPLWNYSYDVAQTATHLYVADGFSGVWVVDKTSLAVTAQPFSFFTDLLAVSSDGSLLFVADDSGVAAYELTDPSNPAFVSSLFALDTYSFESTGSTLYVGTETDALVHVIDFSTPTNPQLVRSLGVAGGVVGLALHDGRLYAYGGPDDVVIYDLANPLDPAPIGTVTDVAGFAFTAEDGVLYLSTADLTAYDVTDPATPTLIGTYSGFATGAAALTATEDRVLVAAQSAGLYRLASDFSVAVEPGPTSAFAVEVFPNPFQARSTIRVVLAQPEVVRVEVFDLLGRRVRTLTDGHRAAGVHTIEWDGRTAQGAALPSGVYLVRVQAGTQTETFRLTRL